METIFVRDDLFALKDGDDVVLFNPKNRRWYFTETLGLELVSANGDNDLLAKIEGTGLSVSEAASFVSEVLDTLSKPIVRQAPRRGSAINVTNRCNMRCMHCRPSSGKSAKRLSVETIERYLAAERGSGSLSVAITGGEPLMAWQVSRDAILEARRLGMDVNLLTNGSLITEDKARFFLNNHVAVQVSLDTVDPSRFMQFRGYNLDSVLRGVGYLLAVGVPVSVSYTLTAMNVGDIDAVIDYCLEKGIKSLHLAMLERGGRANENWRRLVMSDDEIMRFHGSLLDRYFDGLRERLPIDDYEMMIGQVQRPPATDHCNLMCGVSALHEDGLVYGCTNLCGNQDYLLGSAGDAAEMRRSQERIKKRLPTVDTIDACRACDVRWLCLGGCRDRVMLANGGGLCHADPHCRVLHYLFTRLIMEAARLSEAGS